MRVALRFLLAAVVLCPLAARATIINIPGDYPTIQEGIDHGADGDTVLVQPDIYYENVNFNGHNVLVASLLLITGDTVFTSATVIDGRASGSVVTFERGEDSTAVVLGFTIRNGMGSGSPRYVGGGLTCKNHSNPTISNNRISGNRSFYNGGAILCWDSNPTVVGNTIKRNSSTHSAGGVFCRNASPSIRNNIITDNSCDGLSGRGGGVLCEQHSSAMISNNNMSDNGAYLGGAIYCTYSNPTIRDNTMSGNWAGYSGGGIFYGDYSSPTISGNVISKNTADYRGGGISCDYPSPAVISNNTIYDNWAARGGGICCHANSTPLIVNTILNRNGADYGHEIYVESGGDPTVRFSNVMGGWPGQGNIDAEPMFAGRRNKDFHLRWPSPCIDAGDPDPQYNDPDGTRNDIGAFYFDQDVDGIVEVYPHDEPIALPPEGGDVTYDGWAFNFSNNPLTVDIRSYLYLNGIGRYHRVRKHKNVSIPVGDSIGENSIINTVPSFFPAGDYTLVAYIGGYPMREIVDSCYFYFSKAGSLGGAITDWFEGEGWFKEPDPELSNLPADYALSQNHPNPFNAKTTIQYQLAADAHVKLEIYNTLGQKVATLVNEKQQAGYRSATWDASKVSSGLYFCKLTAGDFTETRRMMLVK